MVWSYGVGLAFPVLAMVYLTMLFMAFNTAYGKIAGDTNFLSTSVTTYIQQEVGSFMGMTALVWVYFAMSKKAWTDGMKAEAEDAEATELYMQF